MADNGGPAFPRTYGFEGMSLRDYFAGQAVTGIIMRDAVVSLDTAAKKAYEVADAMLGARESSRG